MGAHQIDMRVIRTYPDQVKVCVSRRWEDDVMLHEKGSHAGIDTPNREQD
jgi:hypothetical protein